MKRSLFKRRETSRLKFCILCLGILFSVKIASGQIRVGDVVKIQNLGATGAGAGFLADGGTTSVLATSGNIEWVVQRSGVAQGTAVTSGMFPKLMNLATGKYLAGSGSPIQMATTDYGSGEFWTPVDIDPSTNTPAMIDAILNAFKNPNVGYPNQYTYVLYSGLSGQGKNPAGQPAPPATIPAIPIIKTPVYYDRKVAFVSNGAVILIANASGQVAYGGSIIVNGSVTNQNMWYIKLVRTYIQESFRKDLATASASTTPQVALNTLINTAKYSTVASTLIDIPSKDNSIYVMIKMMNFGLSYGFNPFTGGSAPTTISDALFQTLKDIKTFLSNPNLPNYLSSNVDTATGLTEKNFATNFLNFVSFIIDLKNATTPGAVIAIVNNSSYLSYTPALADSPNKYISIFTKIQSFFTNNVPNVTGQALTDLKTLLTNANLNKFVSTTNLSTVTNTLLPAVNTAVAIANNKAAFVTALNNSTTPSAINNIVNTAVYNSVTYLVDYPSAATGVFSKIQSFFNTDNTPKYTTLADLTALRNLLINTNLNKFVAANLPTVTNTLVPAVNTAINKVDFTSDLTAAAASPTLLNTLISSGKSATTNMLYNTLTPLVDYPSATTGVFSKIQSFFNTDNTPKYTTLADLTALKNLLTNTNLNKFVSTGLPTITSTLLPAVNTAITKVDFTADLTAAAASPTLLNSLVASGKSANTNIVYNTLPLPSLVDYPSTTTGVFSKIQSFFNTDNTPKYTALADLTVLRNLLTNTNLNKFVSTDLPTITNTLLPAVNTAINKVDFTSDLTAAAASPTLLNTLISSGKSATTNMLYNTLTYLVDYPATTGVFSKIQNFFNSDNTPKYTALADLTILRNLLTNTNLNKFVSADLTTITNTLLPAVNTSINKFDFTSDLAAATTPTLLNTLVNAGASVNTKNIYNTLTNLADYPSTTNSVFTKIQSLFINNVPTVAITELTALQTLLGGTAWSTTLNPNLTKFLTPDQQTIVKSTLLPAVNSEAALITNEADFTAALAAATTPTLLKTLVETGASTNTKTIYNSLTYLTDYPSTTNSIFTKIRSFFTNNVPNVTDTELMSLQSLLGDAAGSTTLNTNLTKFLTQNEIDTVTNLLSIVNNRVDLITALNNIGTNYTNENFGTSSDTWPTQKTIFAIVNNNAINDASYQGASGGNLIYTKLKGFYDNRTAIGLFNLSDGWNGLLDKAKDKAFLSDIQKQDIANRAIVVVSEFGLIPEINTFNSTTNKLDAIKNFFANAIAVDTAKNLRAKRAMLTK